MSSKKKILISFIGLTLFYFFLSIIITYNFKMYNYYNFFFEADSPRVASDFLYIIANHYRVTFHPLVIILFQPIVQLLTGITHDNNLGILLFFSIVGALQSIIMYKTIILINKDSKKSFIIAAIYSLTFSNIIFNLNLDLYNLASLFLLMIWYFVIKDLYTTKTKNNYFIMYIILGVLSIAITLTNYIVFLIACFILLISRKHTFWNLVKINLIVIVSLLTLNQVQSLIWGNVPTLLGNEKIQDETEENWVDFNINTQKIKNVISDDYYNSIIASKIKKTYDTQNKIVLSFHKVEIINIIIVSLLFLYLIIGVIVNFKKNLFLNIGIMLALLFNSLFHLVYGNANAFLYSEHFVYLLFLLLGTNLINGKHKLNINYIFIPFMIYELVINLLRISEIYSILDDLYAKDYYANYSIIFNLILYIVLIIIAVILIKVINKYLISKIKSTDLRKLGCLILSIYIISLMFVAFVSAKTNHTVFGIEIEKYKYTEVDYAKKTFKKFKYEIEMFEKYYNEYKEFKEESKAQLDNKIYSNNYYLFGFANRKKLIYNNGKLTDSNNKIIKTFNVKNQLIIPNIYTILIELKNGKFVKIYENENGVFINDKIVEETDVKVNLYKFNNEKYSTILSELYGEILVNIVDGKILPNYLVYNKPFYRDAAITSFVLKYTNNLDLITDWVDNIEDVYDMQNGKVKEPDNLGELLVLTSYTKNNVKLKNKIIKEANRIIDENHKGKYLTGKTDFGNQNKYQTLWYKVGMEMWNESSTVSAKGLKDSYSSTAWWSNDCAKTDKNISSNNYPYLDWGSKHCGNDIIVYLNSNLYPLSYEKNASQAKYDNLTIINKSLKDNKISPTHTWMASELFMYILDIND